MKSTDVRERNVKISLGAAVLSGELATPDGAKGVVLFAHGSGSSRHSPRNQYVARVLREAGIATLLFDLLTPKEELVDIYTRHLRFDIGLLAERLAGATGWLAGAGMEDELRSVRAPLRIGYFGASTGGAAALVAAARLGGRIAAVVSRGGRPDLSGAALKDVQAPTLLLVGEKDEPVITMNQTACAQLTCDRKLEIIPGATHLFEEPGSLEQVAGRAADWFVQHFEQAPRAKEASGARL